MLQNAGSDYQDVSQMVTFDSELLSLFAKLRKATISCVIFVRLPVRLSVRRKQLGSNRTNFQEILYLRIFRKSVENISFINIWRE
jgi:hypothetical protein